MEIPDEIVFNFCKDLQKKDMDRYDRAVFLKAVMDERGLSIRDFARQTDIPRSTVEDWLLPTRVSQPVYEAMKEDLTATEIYTKLRKNKKNPVSINLCCLNKDLKRCKKILGKYKKLDIDKSYNSQTIIKDLQSILNDILIRIM